MGVSRSPRSWAALSGLDVKNLGDTLAACTQGVALGFGWGAPLGRRSFAFQHAVDQFGGAELHSGHGVFGGRPARE